MSDLTQLSAGEAVYFGGHIGQLPDYAKLFSQEEADTIRTFSQKKRDAIAEMRAPAQLMECAGVTQVRTLRRAIRKDGGRPKATETELANNQQRREQRAAEKEQERKVAIELKEKNRRHAQAKAAKDQKALLEIKQQQERLQQLQNKKAATIAEPYTGPLTHEKYHLITTGVHAIPGKVGVVIDPKNTIYVKNGVDIDLAVERHFLNRKVARLFNDHQ